MKLSEKEYLEHVDNYDGYCAQCDAMTREGETEPDAEEYECPECEADSCMGAENALIAGHLEIE